MRTYDYLDHFMSVLEDTKKVSKSSITKEELGKFLMNLDAINTLERDTKRYNGSLLSEIVIPKLFLDFIVPNSVTVNGGSDDMDFLVRELTPSKLVMMNDVEFINFTNKFNTTFRIKEDNVQVVKLDKTLSKLIEDSVISYENHVTTGKDGSIPVQLIMQFKQDYCYCEDVKQYVKRCISKRFGEL